MDITGTSVVSKAKLGSGRLMGPKGVSVDQNGHVIVVDNKACTVFIFQLTGKLIAKFGSRGTGDKQFAGKPDAPLNCCVNKKLSVRDSCKTKYVWSLL